MNTNNSANKCKATQLHSVLPDTTNIQSNTRMRILLLKEGDDRGEWTAAGMDHPIVTFGATQAIACEKFEQVFKFEQRRRRSSIDSFEDLYRTGTPIETITLNYAFTIRTALESDIRK